MKKLLFASAAAMVLAGTAYAAEPIFGPLPPAAPVVEPFAIPTWAGPYIGADIGWGWMDDDEDLQLFDVVPGDTDIIRNEVFGHDNGGGDGLAGGIFAGWLGQTGSFLYGVELYGQLADLGDDDDDRRGRGLLGAPNGAFDWCGDIADIGGPDVDNFNHRACVGRNRGLDGLVGLEGVIGWGGERAAFLLHAGPVYGFFNGSEIYAFDDNLNGAFDPGEIFRGGNDDDDRFGISVAAEGRLKLTERIFAGLIGRAAWFGDADDDHGRGRADYLDFIRAHQIGAITPFSPTGPVGDEFTNFDFGRDSDNDNVLFEVKARVGVMFGQPAAAAPLEGDY